MITIVMYHYVRDLERTRYPRIGAMSVPNFIGQLDYLQHYYKIVTTGQVIRALRGGDPLPYNACLLTFDDGYLDHYLNVFPVLEARGLSGSFYIPASVLGTGKVLQINKVHFVLASVDDHGALTKFIFERLAQFRGDFDFEDDEELFATYSQMSRWDSPDTAFVKKVLQNGLPTDVSAIIANDLFDQFAHIDEAVLANELYMNMAQLQTMLRAGMEIGGHGFSHKALGNLGYDEQELELVETKRFLEMIYGNALDRWILTYPSGSYNRDTVKILEGLGCSLAMTTEVGVAHTDAPLELARLNANDFPAHDAPPNEWTRKALMDHHSPA